MIRFVISRACAMPMALVIFSLAPWSVMVLFFCASLAPEFEAEVFGQLVTRAEWWSSGAGVMVTIGLVTFSLQLTAIIYRFNRAELSVAGAWIIFSMTELWFGPALAQRVVGDPYWDSWIVIAAISASVGVLAYAITKLAPGPRAYLS